jgi:glycosyltransferase involved in cell wall biosynthesis
MHRVTIDGKFFRAGPEKFHVKGVTYGPFAPDAQGETFGSREQVEKDFAQIAGLGANTVRVYYVPPRWVLDLAEQAGLRVFIDIPWPKHLCFLDRAELQGQARQAIREAVTACGKHPAVLAFSLVNEISPEIARWSGPNQIERFIEDLVDIAHAIDPGALCTFAGYPPTEFLRPRNVDFLCFNVYLHQRPSFEAYLARLQSLAESKPLMLGEVGMDSWKEGEEAKCEFLAWQIEAAFRCGLAGIVIFSFTDEWFRGGFRIEDWSFGLTTEDRAPKASFRTVREQFQKAPRFPLPRVPKVSVVVASYNGGKTLKICLESLGCLNYADYEVILVDDGSTDNTPEIAARFPAVHVIRQPNKGLSVARNVGIAAATGEIVAFTDSDCRVDEDWLYYIVGDLLRGDFTGMGGPNFLPPEDSPTAAAVMASPGGPAHVMLTDREAEHIPGCNMAFFKFALEQIGGFDPVFRKAGDDVDLCWRLQTEGYRLGFSHAGFVWHYRRSTIRAYLRQQAGYGEAEGLLARKHPEFFSSLGGSIWRGRIYAASSFGVVTQRPVIYHGLFGSAAFQRLYASQPVTALLLLTSLQWHLAATVPLFLLSLHFPTLLPLAVVSIAISVGVCVVAAAQVEMPAAQRRWWTRPLVALLCFLQPIVRGWARYRTPLGDSVSARVDGDVPPGLLKGVLLGQPIALWAGQRGFERFDYLRDLLDALKGRQLEARMATEWSRHDLEAGNGPWARLWLSTVTEEMPEGRRVLRIRLRTAWTLRAVLAFGATLAATVLATGVLASQSAWIWMSPLVLPLIYYHFENQGRRLEQLVAATVLESGRRFNLTPLTEDPRAKELDARKAERLAAQAG